MTCLDVTAEAARPRMARDSRGVFGWICTSNPFYVLSALLVCLGLWVSFGSQVDAAQTWSLLSGMAGYTLLLAVTACLLVRYVGVWDDVRTVMLLVVLMFLATSVTFDEVVARDPMRGVACYLGGVVFAVAVSEGMLRGVRLRLPALFRAPYYFVLTLFFVYPVALTPLVDRPRSEELSWALFGFSPAAALVFLTLLPAIRRGRDYVQRQRQPMALGVVSMDPVWRTGLRGPGAVGAFVLVDAPRTVRRWRALHLRPLFPRSVRTCNRSGSTRDRAGRKTERLGNRSAHRALDPGLVDARRPSGRTHVPVVPRAVCLSPGRDTILPDAACLGGFFRLRGAPPRADGA